MPLPKTFQSIDKAARDMPSERHGIIFSSAKVTNEKRYQTLWHDYPDPDRLRKIAGEVKQHTLEHLDEYLPKAEAALKANGAHVHFAESGERANAMILKIMQDNGCKKMVKAKSMVSEEIHLVPYLEKHGLECLETDLGEFILQIDHDHPSHIIKPIIHKNRYDVARSFEREGLGAYNDDPQTITQRARQFLRHKYLAADIGLTGGNFVSAESGRIVLITNEGNARFCMAATKIHVAIIGIEKLVPSDRDLALYTNLIARSGSGQQLTVYTQFINGPKSPAQPDGPEQMHVIFLDNRRTEVLASDCREILRCIRCGACLNVCPVYRQAGGHAYRSVYPGPIGAVLSPLLAGSRFPELADLPKASSLCGACNEVCPVNIPIPDLLLRLRDRGKREHTKKASAGTPPMGMYALLASQPHAWRSAMTLGKAVDYAPQALMNIVPAAQAWTSVRKLPPWRGGKFRQWVKNRQSTPPAHD